MTLSKKNWKKNGDPKKNAICKKTKEKMIVFMSEWKAFMEIENYIGLDGVKIEDLDGEKIGIELIEKILPIIEQ